MQVQVVRSVTHLGCVVYGLLLPGCKPVQHVTVLDTVSSDDTVLSIRVSTHIKHGKGTVKSAVYKIYK